MRPIRTVTADLSATFESLGTLLSSHRAATRASLAALSFAILAGVSQESAPATTAGPDPSPPVPESLLPETLGTGVASDEPVTIEFDAAVDRASVEAGLQILPTQKVSLAWNEAGTELTVSPSRQWRTDERYLIVVPAVPLESDGEATRPLRFTFSTQSAPVVTDFQVRLVGAPSTAAEPTPAVPPEGTAVSLDPIVQPLPPGTQPPTQIAEQVSATSAITVSFSRPMDRPDVEAHFAIAPEVEGGLSWEDGELVFEPSGRLEPGARYTVSLIGAHDAEGNVLGGKANFSFLVQAGAQLTRTQPEGDATGVEPATVEMWFSQPMDVDATNEAFGLRDTSTGALVGGRLTWNDAETQLIYTPDSPFAGGRTFEVSLARGARDVDGNAVSVAWTFTTEAPPPPPPAPPAPAPATAAPPAPVTQTAPSRSTTTTRVAPVVPAPAPATSLAGHALNQVNAARAAYGFPPVVLDANVSAAAAAHAWDQARNNYFSHYSLDGRSRQDRLRAAGVSFSYSAENQCYYFGMSQQATLDWCHQQFMAEPYPGEWNHIANILNPNARRMGVGIATVGSKTIITWNFTD